MRKWWCTLIQGSRKNKNYVIFVESQALKTAWELYREGRVFDAATLLNTGYAPVFLRVNREMAESLGRTHPKGYWMASEPPMGSEELWLHIVLLGWEGAMEAPFVMCFLPSLDTHEVVCVDEEVIKDIEESLEEVQG
jgi:hypothetical protein